MANVEETLDELMTTAQWESVSSDMNPEEQLRLMVLGMEMRGAINPDGMKLIYIAAAYGILRRYADKQEREERSVVA